MDYFNIFQQYITPTLALLLGILTWFTSNKKSNHDIFIDNSKSNYNILKYDIETLQRQNQILMDQVEKLTRENEELRNSEKNIKQGE